MCTLQKEPVRILTWMKLFSVWSKFFQKNKNWVNLDFDKNKRWISLPISFFWQKLVQTPNSIIQVSILSLVKRWLKWFEFNYLNRFLVEKAWDIFFWTIDNLWDFPNPQHGTWNPLTHIDNQILPKSCIDIKNLSFTIFTLSAFGSLTSTKISQK